MQSEARTNPDEKPFAVSGRVFSKLTSRLSGRETLAMTHGELERLLDKEGRELIRQLLQDHLDLRGSGEVHGDVVGARDVRRPHARMRERKLETIFGTVTVTRAGYSAHDAETLFPRDAELNLPPELYSHGVQRRAADEVIKTSFDQAVMALASTTGAAVPKRQIEELAGRAAEDFDAFYEGRSADSVREARNGNVRSQRHGRPVRAGRSRRPVATREADRPVSTGKTRTLAPRKADRSLCAAIGGTAGLVRTRSTPRNLRGRASRRRTPGLLRRTPDRPGAAVARGETRARPPRAQDVPGRA